MSCPDANVDTVVIAVDYDRLDSGQLTELKQQADKEHLEGLSKKKRKKLLKKRTKDMFKKAKVIMLVPLARDLSSHYWNWIWKNGKRVFLFQRMHILVIM